MEKQYIKKGAFLIARKIFESDVFTDKPPFYFKLWVWLIGRARYTKGEKLSRGWLITTYKELAEKAAYKIGYRKTKPTKAQIDWFMRFLRNSGRIRTIHTTRGVKIFIKKYEEYQDLSNYERTHEHDNGHDNDTKAISHDRKERNKKDKENIGSDKPTKQRKRKKVSFKRKWYSKVLSEYQGLKEMNLQGPEFLPVKQTIKTMFMAGRTPDQIIPVMRYIASQGYEDWTIRTVKMKLPEILPKISWQSKKKIRDPLLKKLEEAGEI